MVFPLLLEDLAYSVFRPPHRFGEPRYSTLSFDVSLPFSEMIDLARGSSEIR